MAEKVTVGFVIIYEILKKSYHNYFISFVE